MDKIDIRDLRVGNWVKITEPDNYAGAMVKISSLSNQEGAYIAVTVDDPNFGYFIREVFCEDIEPIPLTREILEKNGFDIYNQEYTSETVYELPGYLFYLETYTSAIDPYFHAGCSIVTTRRLGFNHTWMTIMCHIHYVHQLQNILRDLEIEKDIVL